MTMRRGTMIAISVTAAFVVLFAVLGSWYTVDEGERGVRLRNGAVVGVANPGLGFKMPFVDDVVSISVRSGIRQYPEMAAYSRDQQTATMRVSVNYRLAADQVQAIYSQYGSEEGVVLRLIDPRVFEAVKTVFGQFDAVTAIQERGRLNSEVAEAVQRAVSGPVAIDGVQIENIDFSDIYESSIEQRMQAQVEVERLRQNAQREKVQAEIVVTQAKAKADSTRAAAQATADSTLFQAKATADSTRLQAEAEAASIRVRGDAEAAAIRARNGARVEALRATTDIISLVQAERWDGKLPTTMLPGGTVPMLNLTPAPANGVAR